MKIAIIDDQQEIRYSVAKILQRYNHTPFQFNGEEFELSLMLEAQGVELLIVDVMLGGSFTGIDLIKQFKKAKLNLPVILMTAYTTPSNMIEASKIGIKDILQKPFDETELLKLVEKYVHVTPKKKSESIALKQGDEAFVGSYETMKEIYKKIGIAANNDLCVLVYGETGTGKELIANLIHTNSERNAHAFIAVNCASIPKDLFESQLFGHEKGSFTSADKQHIGYAEQTGEGTLFLDEIGELDSELQSKLLRFLETKKFRRIGGSKEITFEGRIISATNAKLKELSQQKLFREDLYFRLSMLTITMPTLQERKHDIPILCEHFIAKANHDLKTSIAGISQEVLALFRDHAWRGNIRELRNTIYSACLNANDEIIRREDIQEWEAHHDLPNTNLEDYCRHFLETHGIERVVELKEKMQKTFLHVSFSLYPNITQLSTLLDISRNTLKKQLKEFGIYETEEEK
ncbi:sigma-54-dependent transcriptional regulator [Sulfurospirillum barnesii]|uniref:DNA-binding transcriptional regulator NtrC n=1 Tax=Sulfurospirillum barnesii (strain ATCC 700032 / DSM 10660 / SES-3) TaxID=760154 RepID=I3Y0F8_SULBS|nr:sigma-54 dependent transcriptional regulator [Sulfurospirillum barnesii]AFL69682.1 response regulator with CheY-like receiver, AAA-type ATPase, and DNA-binding domains [Sulfurospirillum barnesii SES-3]